MSIIYDALRKVEKKVVPPHVTAGRKIWLYMLFASVALCGFFLAGLISTLSVKALARLKPPKTAAIAAAAHNRAPAAVAAPAAAVVAAPATAPSAARPNLVLNGVFFSDQDGYALINNQIVKEGDTIENAKVTAVVKDGVELEVEGKPLKLTLKK
ncbi:MAG TPA: type II secretion system protein N [Patescibacteria group bacterium]|nr:type II secretion system protein N [Patescibacteria group bacterium]